MMLEIQTGTNNKILRTPCEKVTRFDQSLQEVIIDMTQTMLSPSEDGVIGVSLAANQVGINKKIILITLNVNTKKRQKVLPLINPEIIELSPVKEILEEGCLSLPEVYAKVSRPKKVKVRWQNEKGNWCEKKFDSWDARIFLHEYDHLEGKLFTDYLAPMERTKALEALKPKIRL